jgi:hypothetical protein
LPHGGGVKDEKTTKEKVAGELLANIRRLSALKISQEKPRAFSKYTDTGLEWHSRGAGTSYAR